MHSSILHSATRRAILHFFEMQFTGKNEMVGTKGSLSAMMQSGAEALFL